MFEGLTDRQRGAVALALQEKVAEDIDRLICQLLGASISLWEHDNWMRYDDEEGNCTVQLYRCCEAARRQDLRFILLIPHLEWINLTPAMLAGDESVKTANRPDLRIEVGKVGRTIECKRLAPTGGWTRAYVHEGLARFVVGNYGRVEAVGYMVGYAQAGTLARLLTMINRQVAGHQGMGTAHQLKLLREDGASLWSRSSHPRASGKPISVDHLLVDVAR
jgi:hypothetical protein